MRVASLRIRRSVLVVQVIDCVRYAAHRVADVSPAVAALLSMTLSGSLLARREVLGKAAKLITLASLIPIAKFSASGSPGH